jgi:hypothetical protein
MCNIDVALYLLCDVYMLLVYMYMLLVYMYMLLVYMYTVCMYVCGSVREFLCVVCVYCLMYHYFFCKAPRAIDLECGAI